jgi:hypothetical protein
VPDYYTQFESELKTIVKEVWSLVDTQVFTSMQALRNNVVNEIAEGQQGNESDLSVPFAVISIGRFDPDPTWGLNANAKRAPVVVWYIDRLTDRNNQAHLAEKLYALEQEMREDGHGFQVDGDAQLDSGENNPANAEFLENGVLLMAGSVSWPAGILVGEHDVA